MTDQFSDERVSELHHDAVLLREMNAAFAAVREDAAQWQAFRREIQAWESADTPPASDRCDQLD